MPAMNVLGTPGPRSSVGWPHDKPRTRRLSRLSFQANLEKCGFQEEGFLRKHLLKDGQFIDARLFALLR